MSKCPILSAAALLTSAHMAVRDHEHKCIREQCQWWVSVYTTEGYSHEGCAIELKACMNSEGRFVV